MPLYLEIVTPDSIAFAKEVKCVVLPTLNGRIQILPKHIPIIDRVIPGYVKVELQDEVDYFSINRGFVEVYGEKVSIITDGAAKADEEDEAAMQQQPSSINTHEDPEQQPSSSRNDIEDDEEDIPPRPPPPNWFFPTHAGPISANIRIQKVSSTSFERSRSGENRSVVRRR